MEDSPGCSDGIASPAARPELFAGGGAGDGERSGEGGGSIVADGGVRVVTM